MLVPKFSVNRCSKNPQRWNVYFNNSKPFHLHSIRKILERNNYQILVNTPNLVVFRSKNARFTWHNQGFIQVDIYDSSMHDAEEIEHLIKDIFVLNSMNFFGEALGH